MRSDLPDGPGQAVLLVALRGRPELTHYDPESVEYWVTRDGRGTRTELDRQTNLPLEQRFSWGTIRLVDRVGATNETLTFGGCLTAASIGDLAVAVFASPAPMLRRGGHSQGWDEAADDAAAFLARVKVAVDFVPGFEARFAIARPIDRYAAFVVDIAERFRGSRVLRDLRPDLASLIRAEERRLAEDPRALPEGRSLLAVIRRAGASVAPEPGTGSPAAGGSSG